MKYTVIDFAGFELTYDNPMEAWEEIQYLKEVMPDEVITLEVE